MSLAGTTWEFSRSNGTVIGYVELRPDNTIGLYQHHNERYWAMNNGQLVFMNGNQIITTVFAKKGDEWVGAFNGHPGAHLLRPADLDMTPYPTKTSEQVTTPFSFADTPAYLLSVEGELRRQHHCRSEIAWMGFKETRMIVGKTETECPSGYARKSFYGSSKNHHQALLDMKKRGEKYAAFFEDDLILTSWYDDHILKSLETLKGIDWHVLFLKSGSDDNIVKKMGSINQIKGCPITGMQYIVRDSGGFLDFMLAICDPSNAKRRVKHADVGKRFIIDGMLRHNLDGWNVYGTAMDMTIHENRIFKQRSERSERG